MVILAAVDGESNPDETVRVGYDIAEKYGEELVVLHLMPQDEFD